jgi:hypothetical protein
MPAHRRAGPASKLAGDAPWLADAVDWPEAKALALEHLYRALDFLLRPIEALEPEIFLRTAELFHADVDLIFGETTPLSCEIAEEDDAREPGPARTIPARRTRGHHTEGRDGNPQGVVGRALTRDGLPVRAWVVPGHTAAVTTSNHLKEDVQGWRLNRGVFVGDSGMFSAAKRPRRSRALGRYLLAVPMRQVTAVQLNVLTRAGRDRDVAHHRRGKEVDVGEGERRRRYLVCHNPDAAAREHAHRERLVKLVRAALATLDARQADHPTKACALMASRRFGRYLRMEAPGCLSIKAAKVAAAAKDDGQVVVTTNDDTLDAEDVVLGDSRMTLIEGCFRPMKTPGLQTRPIDHGRPQRLIAQVKRWVLALLLERAAEIRGQPTWRTVRQTLDPLKVVRDRLQGKTMIQRPQVTSPMAAIFHSLGMPLPKNMLDVFE